MALSAGQIATLMRNAGFPEEVIPTGVAVALAESGGDPSVDNPRSSATGLWQILDMHGLSEAQRDDPQTATNYAYKLFQERGWQPWEAYNTGAHRKYLGADTLEWNHPAGAGAPVQGFNPGSANVGVPAYNPWANMKVPNYPSTPRPLPPEAILAFSERQRAATRALQEALARRQRGVAETETSFQQFLRDLGRQTDKGLDVLRDEGAARNLAFQPAFMGRGQRDIRDEQAEALARGSAKKASRLRELEQGVTDARQRRQEERAAIDRDKSRLQARFKDFIGGLS